MTHYVLLYSGGSGMPEGEEAQAAEMKKWEIWYGNMGEHVADGGNPFGKEMTISPDGSVREVAQGTHHTGYSIIKADSFDKAVELAKGCPVLDSGGDVSVFETFQVM